MTRFYKLVFLACTLIATLASCTHHGPDPRLADIERSIEDDPRKAFDRLAEINPESLDDVSRPLRNLLLIKAADKAYLPHTSDSLILEVIAYYGSRQNDPRFPESMYYAGRVYSDLGDSPTALGFFHKALDAVPDNHDNLRFKSNLLSQTGRLLERLRLHRQAIPYLKKAVGISKALNDSAGTFYDLMLLMSVYMNCDSIKLAKECQSEALAYSDAMPSEDKAWLDVERTVTLLHEEKIDSALSVIRPVVNSVDTLCTNYALGIAAHTYKAAGILDTAYLYARELAFSHKDENRVLGFSTLLSPEVFHLIPVDSIGGIVHSYGRQMERYLNRSQSDEALIQNSRYNYSVHMREREKAEADKAEAENFRNCLMVLCIGLTLLSVMIIRSFRASTRITELRLTAAIRMVRIMEYEMHFRRGDGVRRIISLTPLSLTDNENEKHSLRLLTFTSRKENLRKELLQRLSCLTESDTPVAHNRRDLSDSPIKDELDTLLSSQKGINDTLWDKIESALLKDCPDFKTALMTLTLDRMTDREYQVALLIRYGFKPKDIALLISRGKSAATDRRRSLARKIFGDSADTKALDRLIQRI